MGRVSAMSDVFRIQRLWAFTEFCLPLITLNECGVKWGFGKVEISAA